MHGRMFFHSESFFTRCSPESRHFRARAAPRCSASSCTTIHRRSPIWLPAFHRKLKAVARICLEKDPARRYPDCAAVAAALREAGARVVAMSQAETISLVPKRDPGTEKRRRAVRVAAFAALITAIAAGAGFWLHSMRAPATRPLGLAVLPFTNVSNDSRAQAFGLGLVMAVSSNLGAVGDLQNSFWIVSQGDVLQARIQSAREARQLFGVDLAVTGSIEVSGNNIRVISGLTDARTQHQKGTRQITRPIGDALKLEDDLAETVAQLLQVALPADNRNAIRIGRQRRAGSAGSWLARPRIFAGQRIGGGDAGGQCDRGISGGAAARSALRGGACRALRRRTGAVPGDKGHAMDQAPRFGRSRRFAPGRADGGGAHQPGCDRAGGGRLCEIGRIVRRSAQARPAQRRCLEGVGADVRGPQEPGASRGCVPEGGRHSAG